MNKLYTNQIDNNNDTCDSNQSQPYKHVIITNNTEPTELTLPHSNINMQPKHKQTNTLKYKPTITPLSNPKISKNQPTLN